MMTLAKFKPAQAGPPRVDIRKYTEAYYRRELRIWRPFRVLGLITSVFGIVLAVVAMSNRNWIMGRGRTQGLNFISKTTGV